MTFDDFWEIKGGGCTYDIGKYIWDEAQEAERERLNKALDELAPAFAELCKKLQLGEDR